MKLATWNVNSIKVRLPHLLDWLGREAPDVVCLQETKTEDAGFPFAPLEALGYHVLHHGQKTYNGVALLSRGAPEAVQRGIPGFDDVQSRLLAATISGVRVVCAYVPNGEAVDSPKYPYKLAWLDALLRWLTDEVAVHERLALLGDYNIAPEDRDVYDPVAWAGKVLCSVPEREAFGRLLGLGLRDTFRQFEQADPAYSWWDYRMNAFRRNIGLRIDHILATDALCAQARSCQIDRSLRALERPSDHAPVVLHLA